MQQDPVELLGQFVDFENFDLDMAQDQAGVNASDFNATIDTDMVS